jgi:hypothetical protein
MASKLIGRAKINRMKAGKIPSIVAVCSALSEIGTRYENLHRLNWLERECGARHELWIIVGITLWGLNEHIVKLDRSIKVPRCNFDALVYKNAGDTFQKVGGAVRNLLRQLFSRYRCDRDWGIFNILSIKHTSDDDFPIVFHFLR